MKAFFIGVVGFVSSPLAGVVVGWMLWQGERDPLCKAPPSLLGGPSSSQYADCFHVGGLGPWYSEGETIASMTQALTWVGYILTAIGVAWAILNGE